MCSISGCRLSFKIQMKSYKVNRIDKKPLCTVEFSKAEVGNIDQIREESSSHHPPTAFALLHDKRNLYLRFDIDDQYVKSVHTELHSAVSQDSCVEFFVRPKSDKGYFNFETNAGGTLLASYIEDWTRTPDGFRQFRKLPVELCRKIEIISSLPRTVYPEIKTPAKWHVALKIPVVILEEFTGKLSCDSGSLWRANFYKCAGKTSHPHWLSWSPVKKLNFHVPDEFGELEF
ncbi:MAG: carbohydrate-binding family 9-like protein [Kiritimatiellia bacterium]